MKKLIFVAPPATRAGTADRPAHGLLRTAAPGRRRSKKLTPGRVARRLGVRVDLMWTWLKRGLLEATRDERGHAIFTNEALLLVEVAAGLHRLGVRTPEMAAYLGRLREAPLRKREVMIANAVVAQHAKSGWTIHDSLSNVPQDPKPLAVHGLAGVVNELRR